MGCGSAVRPCWGRAGDAGAVRCVLGGRHRSRHVGPAPGTGRAAAACMAAWGKSWWPAPCGPDACPRCRVAGTRGRTVPFATGIVEGGGEFHRADEPGRRGLSHCSVRSSVEPVRGCPGSHPGARPPRRSPGRCNAPRSRARPGASRCRAGECGGAEAAGGPAAGRRRRPGGSVRGIQVQRPLPCSGERPPVVGRERGDRAFQASGGCSPASSARCGSVLKAARSSGRARSNHACVVTYAAHLPGDGFPLSGATAGAPP